jgi:hypothetical protein
MGFDANSNGAIDSSEGMTLLKTAHVQSKISTIVPYQFIPITQTDYNDSKTQLLGWAANAENIINLPNGSRHLTAFCNGTVPAFAGSEPTTIARNEPGLSHPVGIAFTPTSNPGASFKAIITKDHNLSKILIASNAMSGWLATEFDGVGDQVRRDIVDARKAGGPEQMLHYSMSPANNSMGFGVDDPDLLVTLGKVKLVDAVIVYDVDMFGYVSDVKINGYAEDLYDFDYGGGELLGYAARKASEVQAGFPSLGTGGKVFKTKIDLGGGNPYAAPDTTPYTFYPN